MVSNVGLNIFVKRGGKKVISYLCNTKLPETPINLEGIKYVPALEKDTVQINKIKIIKDKLDNVLRSEYCEMPDYLSLIPKNATEEETIQALKQLFEDSKFFSRVSTCENRYNKNFEFAKRMSKLAEETSKSISSGKSFKYVLEQISQGYPENDFARLGKIGVYRGNATHQPEIVECIGRIDGLQTRYGNIPESGVLQYQEYIERLDTKLSKRILPYENFTLTGGSHFANMKLMAHPYPEEVAKNMEIISERYKVYQKLVSEYKLNGNLSLEQKKRANDIISEIYYLMANTCPFHRGSNGISDVLMRSQYSALGINKPHVRKGVGLDLEAFCMNLDEYKIKWNSFFE